MALRESERLAGQLLVVGFDGTTPPQAIVTAAADGAIGGVVLFKRNITEDLEQVAQLNAAIARAAPISHPLLIAVDQEGGRVARLRAGVMRLPPMLSLQKMTEDGLRDLAEAHSKELLALGFTMNFAPVLDVHSNEHNPIIGDRAFATDPRGVALRALAFAGGMRRAGLLACGKHFPGHGDTSQDSHLELPTVAHNRARLGHVEFHPFAAAAKAGIDALMTAHVVYPALDTVPATVSRKIATDLLRGEFGFRGVLFSDDLEMKALSVQMTYAESSVRAIDAGCDALLVCSSEDAWRQAREAIAQRIEKDAAFRVRCEEAHERFLTMRKRCPSRESNLDLIGTARAKELEAIAWAP